MAQVLAFRDGNIYIHLFSFNILHLQKGNLYMATKNDITGDEIATKIGGKSAKQKFDENFDAIFRRNLPLSEYPDNNADEFDESRIDIISQNGNIGLHYDE